MPRACGVPAISPQRASRAARAPDPAEGRADVHQRVGPQPGSSPRSQLVGEGLERRGVRWLIEERPPEHASHVGVDRPDAPPEGERRHGARRVRPDAREALQRRDVGRNLAAMLRHDRGRGPLERDGPAVVAEAAPRSKDICRRRSRERGRGRVRRHEPRPCLGGSRCLCLLGHDLGHQDRPRVRRSAEGQRAGGPGVPGEDAATNSGSPASIHWRERLGNGGHVGTIAAVRFGAAFWIQRTDWPSLRDACLAADAAGFDSLWIDDHLLSDEGDWRDPKLEGWTSLAAVAALTTRPRLGLLVAANTVRNPGLTAKMATTLDHVSDGRFILGLGGGWFEREHEAFGFDFGSGFGERLDRLEESVGLIERLLAGERVTHDGRFYRMVEALSEPRPIQPRLPILIGGSGREKTLRTTARHADLWNGYGSPAEIAATSEVLRERCEEIGRPFAAIERTVTMDIVIRDSELEANAAFDIVQDDHDLRGRADSAGNVRGVSAAGPPSLVSDYVQEFEAFGISEVIWVFRSPFDLETMARLGEVRAALSP